MKLWKYLPIVIFLSCIDLITQEPQYNSLYFSGGSWIDLKQMSSMKMDPTTNDFSLQFFALHFFIFDFFHNFVAISVFEGFQKLQYHIFEKPILF